jgi:hypothetical protein
MAQLTIELPEELLVHLQTIAKERRTATEEVVLERLIGIEKLSPERERLLAILKQEGLLSEVGADLKKMAQPISEQRRKELREKLSVGKSLSEIIIEDRR